MKTKLVAGMQDVARDLQSVSAAELNAVSGGTFKPLNLLHKPSPNTTQGVWVREVVEDVEAY
jgi:hypothetical protein